MRIYFISVLNASFWYTLLDISIFFGSNDFRTADRPFLTISIRPVLSFSQGSARIHRVNLCVTCSDSHKSLWFKYFVKVRQPLERA